MKTAALVKLNWRPPILNSGAMHMDLELMERIGHCGQSSVVVLVERRAGWRRRGCLAVRQALRGPCHVQDPGAEAEEQENNEPER